MSDRPSNQDDRRGEGCPECGESVPDGTWCTSCGWTAPIEPSPPPEEVSNGE